MKTREISKHVIHGQKYIVYKNGSNSYKLSKFNGHDSHLSSPLGLCGSKPINFIL